ncbi:MAG TPA: hypothetical protein VGN55_04765 [Xanthobacteraceae bacterium]
MAAWDEYINYAEQCVAIARTVGSRERRITLREMAAEWTRLAQPLLNEQHISESAK